MSTVRVMAVFQGFSGLSRDVFVNTFHFVGSGTYDEDKALAHLEVRDFYNLATPVNAQSVGAYLSPWILRDYLIKTYNLEDPPIRVPTNYEETLPTSFSSSSPPEEVAACATLHGSVPPASARRRGRIYIGPLNQNAIQNGTSSTRCKPDEGFINVLAAACARVIDTPLIAWSIRSTRPAVNYVPIVSGYVDDAFDTQRRRGTDPTARTPFIGAA